MPCADRIADRLSDKVCAESPALQTMLREELPALAAIRVVCQRTVDLEVVTPARKLEPVEPPACARGRKLGNRQVGPLARE